MAVSNHDAIQALAHKIQEKVLERATENPYSNISPSAYDTAWVAMLSDPKYTYEKPMFSWCLEWVLNNQRPEGFWGERDCRGNPTIDSLPATLACMVALRMWNLGHDHIERGMAFLNTNLTRLLQRQDSHGSFPRWFAIVYPGMVELARDTGLQVIFEEEVEEAVARVFHQHREILKTEKLVDRFHYPPLLAYLEVLPLNLQVDEATILNNLGGNGSLFRSPSATAAAYMATRDAQMLPYLRNVVQISSNGGVPSMYPIRKDYLMVSMVNQLERLGLSKLFPDQMNEMLEQIYREYNAQEPSKLCDITPASIYMGSLAFQLLRQQGYNVSARRFCRFLSDESALEHIEQNHEKYASALYMLYRATNLMFESEAELQVLRSFTKKLLAKASLSQYIDDGVMLWPHLQEKIKRELTIPWLARLDHLEHRDWIESANKLDNPIWLGKSSSFRISSLDDEDMLQLAKDSYELRQTVYQKELKELLRWSKINGLMDMGFAREKTTYCYFAVASATPSLPYDTYVRLIVTKTAVLITVFDDYFDMEGSLDELQMLANAVQRWNDKGLKSHCKILFDALDKFVTEVANKYLDQHGIDITHNIRKLWGEVVASWLTEATWSKSGKIPSMASYLETGMISIAAHLVVLIASCFMTPSISPHKIFTAQYEDITKHLMISCRLLNDLQSYEKEIKDRKLNSVFLYMKENPGANIEDAIRYVENILEKTKMRLLEYALMDGNNDVQELPKSCKILHLKALKVFQMFFNSANHFDSKDSLLNDINKAIFIPFKPRASFDRNPTIHLPQPRKPHLVINLYKNVHMNLPRSRKLHQIKVSLVSHRVLLRICV